MKTIYIAGPFRAPGKFGEADQWQQEQNIIRAEFYALEVWKSGHVAVCPHSLTRNFQGSLPDATLGEGLIVLMEQCDCVFIMDSSQDSEGTLAEIQRCDEIGLPYFFSVDDCINYVNNLERSEDASHPNY